MNDETPKKQALIIISTFESAKHLEYCIPNLLDSDLTDADILLVDNASSDNTKLLMQNKFTEIKTIFLDENIGWAASNNIGIKYAIENGYKYTFLINPDILIENDWIQNAIECFNLDKMIGIVGFNAIENGQAKVDRSTFYEKIQTSRKFKHTKALKYVDGFAMAINNEVYEKIGYFDEDYFAYCEETDFQIRARKSKYKIFICNSYVWHYVSGSWENNYKFSSFLFVRNIIRMNIKNRSAFHVLYMIGKLFLLSILVPVFKVSTDNVIIYRIAGQKINENLKIFFRAVHWNIVNYSKTKKAL